MAQSVEQAIGRDRVRKAFKRYENRPSDRHTSGLVREVNSDGSFEVLLPNAVQTTRCSCFCSASVGDVVEVVMKADGKCDAIGRLGGEPGRFETVEVSDALTVDGMEFGVNKVLWFGSAYMYEGQEAPLKEAVSAQPHGIVLVWSWYTEANGGENSNFEHFFIPKHQVADHESCGVNCSRIAYDGNMAKYVYVYDTKITGHNLNLEQNTTGGVAYNNKNFALRYVIGV